MYDASLGRFFTKDRFTEKYYSLAPYQYAANNPINFVDINGDSLWINFGDGNRVLYQDGQLLNADGSQYTGDGVKITKKGKVRITNSYLSSAVTALNTLNTTNEGNEIISQLQGSSFNYTVRNGPRTHFDPDNRTNANAVNYINGELMGDPYQPLTDMGSGGTIYFNPDAIFNVSTTRGTRTMPSEIVFGHEMRHAADASTGQLDLYPRDKGDGVIFLGSEIRANYSGNMLLNQTGRKYYQKTIAGSTIPILDANGHPVDSRKPMPNIVQTSDFNY